MKALEHIARQICAAEGYEPDARIMQYTPTVGALGRAVVHGDLLAQWEVYRPVAMAVMTALIDTAPEGEDFLTYVSGVLADQTELPTDPQPEQTIEQNWRVFYGLKR